MSNTVRDLKEGEGTYYLSRFSGSGRVHAALMLTFVVCFDSLVIRVALCKSVITDDISLVQAILHHIKIASKNVFKDTILYCKEKGLTTFPDFLEVEGSMLLVAVA
jgi:hypothetical protein